MARKAQTKISKVTDNPNDAVKAIADDLDKAYALEALSNFEGGKILIKGLISDIVSIVDSLALKYKKLSHVEMIVLCADLKSKMDVMRAITRARKNRDLLEGDLEEALKE